MTMKTEAKVLKNLDHLYANLNGKVSLIYHLASCGKSYQTTLILRISSRHIIKLNDVDFSTLHVMITEKAEKNAYEYFWEEDDSRRILSYEAVKVTPEGVFDMEEYLTSKGWTPELLDSKMYIKRRDEVLNQNDTIELEEFGVAEYIGEGSSGAFILFFPSFLKFGNNEVVYFWARYASCNVPDFELLMNGMKKGDANAIAQLNVGFFEVCHSNAFPSCGFWRIGFINGFVEFGIGSHLGDTEIIIKITLHFEDDIYECELDARREGIRPDSQLLSEFINQLARCESKEQCDGYEKKIRNAFGIAKIINAEL